MRIYDGKKVKTALCGIFIFMFLICTNIFIVSASSTEAKVYDSSGSLVHTSDLSGAISYVNGNSANAYTIEINKNVSLTSSLSVTNTAGVIIKSEAGVLSALEQTGTARHFTVSGRLTLTDIILSGGMAPNPDSGGGGIQVNSSGNFTVGSNAVIQNCYSSANGGGVVVAGGGTFQMAGGGRISGNTAVNGGGVYSSGTFRSDGGEVSGNNAKNNGGGIYVSGGKFEMSGGTVGGSGDSDGNWSTGGGGGVVVAGGGTFLMTGSGKVSGNKSGTIGGGVYLYSGSFQLSQDAKISSNMAETFGGGVYSNSTFTMDGGTIGGNDDIDKNIAVNGGGVYLVGGTFTMTGNSKINGNAASTSGGGVYRTKSNTFTMHDGQISSNTAGILGGGVYNNGTFTMDGGTIGGEKESKGNTASNGGGVYIAENGTFDLSGQGKISGNAATSKNNGGGGVFVNNSFTMNGGTIGGMNGSEGNTAVNGGGIYVTLSGALDISDAGGTSYLIGNHADIDGGGIYTADTTYANLNTAGSTIFKGNISSAPYKPPADAALTYGNIGFLNVSISVHPLNNFDINYTSTTILSFLVEFESNGGTLTDSQMVNYGNKVTRPTDPAKEGYTFSGWYTDNETFDNEWDFDKDTVTKNMILYARWIPLSEEEPVQPMPTEPEQPGEQEESEQPGEQTKTKQLGKQTEYAQSEEQEESIEPVQRKVENVPQTADKNYIALWICLLLISLGILNQVLYYRCTRH